MAQDAGSQRFLLQAGDSAVPEWIRLAAGRRVGRLVNLHTIGLSSFPRSDEGPESTDAMAAEISKVPIRRASRTPIPRALGSDMQLLGKILTRARRQPSTSRVTTCAKVCPFRRSVMSWLRIKLRRKRYDEACARAARIGFRADRATELLGEQPYDLHAEANL